jgi:hypothetical protein
MRFGEQGSPLCQRIDVRRLDLRMAFEAAQSFKSSIAINSTFSFGSAHAKVEAGIMIAKEKLR